MARPVGSAQTLVDGASSPPSAPVTEPSSRAVPSGTRPRRDNARPWTASPSATTSGSPKRRPSSTASAASVRTVHDPEGCRSRRLRVGAFGAQRSGSRLKLTDASLIVTGTPLPEISRICSSTAALGDP